jgi:hypothetical protein
MNHMMFAEMDERGLRGKADPISDSREFLKRFEDC